MTTAEGEAALELPRRAPASLRRWILRVAVSGGFLVLALMGVGAGRVVDAIGRLSLGALAVAVALLAVSHAIAAYRWTLLLHKQELNVPFRMALRVYFVGLFFTNVLPSGFGGDGVRAWMVYKRRGWFARATVSVLMDRLVALWALVALGLIAALLVPGSIPTSTRLSLVAVSGGVLLGSALLLSAGPRGRLARLAEGHERLGRVASPADAALHDCAADRPLLARTFALALASQAFVCLAAWALAAGLDLHVSLLLITACIPVALLATLPPTTINGLGVREAVFRALLVPAGVAPGAAVAFSLVTVLAGAIVSLAGAGLWIADRSGH